MGARRPARPSGHGGRCTCGPRWRVPGPATPDQARDRIAHAKTAADRIDAAAGPPPFDRHSLTFSSGNVAVRAIAVALEAGDQRAALQLNTRTDPAVIAALPNSRQSHHHLDVARA